MSDHQAVKAERILQQAKALERAGRFAEARIQCRRALRLQPRNFAALNLAGILAAHDNDPPQALEFFRLAVAARPQNAWAHNNLGNALQALRRHAEAIASYDRALALDPHSVLAHNNRGNALAELGRYALAIESYDRALAIEDSNPNFHYNRGNALLRLARPAEALRCFDRALALQGDLPKAHHNRALALLELGDHEAAVPSFERALAISSDYTEAWYCRGNALGALGRYEAALESYDRSIALDPQHADAHNNRGNALNELKRYTEALAAFERSLELRPECAEVHSNRANVLRELGRYAEAAAGYETALHLKPQLKFVPGARLISLMHVCDWHAFESSRAAIAAAIEGEQPVTEPFTALALFDSPRLHEQAARIWVREKSLATEALPPLGSYGPHAKIRVGYFSQDFRNHPVAVLTAELFELHDRERFELTAFSYAPASQEELQHRLRRSFDRFLDLARTPDREVAMLARSLEIDIAIDLSGFTSNNRMSVLAMRAAPVQASWLGYLGTTAAPYMDYLIADGVVVPPGAQPHYSEKIVYLPSYQPNDSQRRIADRIFSREELGLPVTGFVYCCFNASYKISPETFAAWMRILAAVPGSVLWLLGDSVTQRNLRAQAQRCGIDPARLVFGERLPFAEYLARFRAADLFLDTLPYNAGTTASDALWAGLPVLTCMGQALAGRVAASLLAAARLPELITTSYAQYEQTAIALARAPQRLEAVRARLRTERLATRLFDTASFVRHLEQACSEMYRRHRAGLAPDHIRIEPMQRSLPGQTFESGNEDLRRFM